MDLSLISVNSYNMDIYEVFICNNIGIYFVSFVFCFTRRLLFRIGRGDFVFC